jgi:hypothetical protein
MRLFLIFVFVFSCCSVRAQVVDSQAGDWRLSNFKFAFDESRWGLQRAGQDREPSPTTTVQPNANPLSLDDGRLIFDIELKSRVEVRDNNYDFDSSVNDPRDASWVLTRYRLGALYTATDWLKFYVQGQDIRELGGSRPNNVGTLGADGDDVFDVLQAWIDLGQDEDGLSLRAGRQPLNYGDQRLLGNPQWLNSTRAWDALRLRYAGDTWQVDLFTGSPVRFINNQWNKSDLFNDHESRNALDSGLYFSSKSLVPWQKTTDFYLLNYQATKDGSSGGAPLGVPGHSNIWTLGTLMKGDPEKLHNWDYDFEMAPQFGRAAGLDHQAFAGHWGSGYNFEYSWKPRLGAQYNYATGDHNSADGKNTTFQNYFPGNHALYGFMDTTAWINVENPQLNFSIQPSEKLKLTVDYNLYWNTTNNDAWYGANTTSTVRSVTAGSLATSRFRGEEVDLNAYYKLNPRVAIQAGYSVYFPGGYLEQTGASDTAQFGYAQFQINF